MAQFEGFLSNLMNIIKCNISSVAVTLHTFIFKEHTASIFRADDGDFMLPKNVDIDLPDYVCLLYKLMMYVTSVVCLMQYNFMWDRIHSHVVDGYFEGEFYTGLK